MDLLSGCLLREFRRIEALRQSVDLRLQRLYLGIARIDRMLMGCSMLACLGVGRRCPGERNGAERRSGDEPMMDFHFK